MKLRNVKNFQWLILFHALIFLIAIAVLMKQKRLAPEDKEEIVVIPIEGVITMERGSLGLGMTVDSLVETLDDLQEEDQVKAVILRINSPGGSVAAVQEISNAIKRLRGKGKVVVSSFGDVSASGGYYIACATDKILCQPGTLTGSIGVIMQLPNVQGLLGKVGVSMQTLKSGSMKDAASPFRPMTEEEKSYFKTVINDAYVQFFAAVKEGRALDDKTLKPLADGRIFTGQMALNNKLVDKLGGLEEAIQTAKELTGLQDKKPHITHHKPRPSFDRLFDLMGRTPLDGLNSLASSKYRLMYILD